MTENVVSFKNAKKRAGYAKKEAQASQNRAKFGRTKAKKMTDTFEENTAKSHLDGHKITDE